VVKVNREEDGIRTLELGLIVRVTLSIRPKCHGTYTQGFYPVLYKKAGNQKSRIYSQAREVYTKTGTELKLERSVVTIGRNTDHS